MKKLKFNLVALSLATFILCGCSYRVLDFTLISSKNVDLTRSAEFVRGKSRVKGGDMIHWIIVFPTGMVDIKEAVDRAIERTPGCVALLDGVIYRKFWYIPYIYGQDAVVVEGLPLIDPSIALNATESPTYGKIELDKKGEVKEVKTLSSYEYLTLKRKIVKELEEEVNFSNSKDVK